MNPLLVKPIITEKSMNEAKKGWYAFEVVRSSHKPEIAAAVEAEFKVHVTNIKTVRLTGKQKRRGSKRLVVTTQNRKKAYVKLKNGEKIEVFGVETPKK